MNPLNLPLVTDTVNGPTWQGFRPPTDWTPAHYDPEPDVPQGEYAEQWGVGSEQLAVENQRTADHRQLDDGNPPPTGLVELLAPAGGPKAGFAAFQHGADAIYLGLKKFSARAEAENFTLEEVDEITAYAHSLSPKRRVFVTINTVIRNDELPELVEDLAALDEIGVDALIVQDLGVWHIVRTHFPKLELHASTQLAVHNRAGAAVLRQLGFHRVVLARELTVEEVHDITAERQIETEVFIHGALCYSYSGLCLFSAQTLGRSGNRGKCAYSCRDSFHVEGAPQTLRDGAPTRRNPNQGFPFSMKDLALPDHLPTLRSAGVSCFKIEGRKKSPLYVATTTSFYRELLDGKIADEDRNQREKELQTVFSRPWTRLFTQSHKDKEVADRDTVGHRGTLIGRVEDVRAGQLCFTTNRGLERHDGLQVDLPNLGKPFGFPVDELWIVNKSKRREVVAAPAGARVEVGLPIDHPNLPADSPVYCSSSQEVKRKYRYDRPKAGLYRTRKVTNIELQVSSDRLTVEANADGVSATVEMSGELAPARDTLRFAPAVRDVFSRLGSTPFALGQLTIDNPENRFIPVSVLNRLRREVMEKLQKAIAEKRQQQVNGIKRVVCGDAQRVPESNRFGWSIKIDRCEYTDAFETQDWNDVDELIIDIARDHPTLLAERLAALGDQLGREKIRLALPAVTRKWEERGIAAKIARLKNDGWFKWEAANLSAWSLLGVDPCDPHKSGLDIATDWSVYVLNRAAAEAVQFMGVSRFALSPEDGRANIKSLLQEYADRAVVIVYQDTPLFIAESCAYANLIGGCPGKANCSFESMQMESSYGEKVTALDYHCRTIVLNQGPFCLSPRLSELKKMGAQNLRADFIYRHYHPNEVRNVWRLIRTGKAVPGGHAANFDRGIL